MAKVITQYSRFIGGIADFAREGIQSSYAFARSIDVRSDPQNITVLPRTIKESGNTIIDLPKWAQTYTSTLTSYIYGDQGNIYSRTSAGSYTNLRTVANSHGNGLVYSAEDDYLYYSLDKVIGRYGPLASATPTFVDDYFGSQGGIPLNTNSVTFASASSQYASRADTSTTSITGDIAFDIQIKPTTLPTAGNQMVLMSKWDESGVLRSYKFDINTASGYFGDSSDGTLTISSDTTEAPIDSACTGSNGSISLSATNASFATGQVVLIHQTQGTGAGVWMRNTITGYTAGTITLSDPLNMAYTSGAQVRVMKQYTNVTINSGKTYTAKAWNGTVGGILAFIASGTVTVTGTISGTGKGFRGGTGGTNATGSQGEGTGGAGSALTTANGNGGGGGKGGVSFGGGGAAGGGNATAGSNGATQGTSGSGGIAGGSAGTTDLTTMSPGGAGGGGGNFNSGGSGPGGTGGNGGAILFISGATLTIGGSIVSGGSDGGSASNGDSGGGGAGAGGSVLLKAQTATIGNTLITVAPGSPGNGSQSGGTGGAASVGRIHLDYYTSYTGTTSPTLDATQDNTLVTNTSYQLRLSVSSTGSNSETLAQTVNLTTGIWQQVGISWAHSTSIANFYLNAVNIGTRTGTLTSIHDNASTFQVAMSKNGAGAAANFYNGEMDEARLFATTRSDSDYFNGLSTQIPVNTTGLNAYYKFNGDYTDATGNSNTLTATNSPTFTSDVPFPSPTTRLDIDQQATTAGNTYTIPVAISEGATDKLTFTPTKDPQKSAAVLIAGVGTGNVTLTVHDSVNNVLAAKTVSHANLTTGYYEFVFSPAWRPLTNFTNQYHLHITSTTGDGTVTTGTSADFSTAAYRTYFQFLVEDQQWHPMVQFLNFWIIGNERYLGTYNFTLYDPNAIVFQPGYRVRCFALWREYLAIGVQKGSNIYDFDSGRIYFWDGIAPTFNFFIDVPEGGINAMLGTGDKLYIWAGYKNQLLLYGWSYQGGGSATKIKDMPKMESTKYSEIYPQAVTMWQALLRYGVAGNGDSGAVQKGVYTWGSTNTKYPEILTYDYPISTGTLTGISTLVGLTFVVNKKLLIGWGDNASYGIDYVDNANMPYPTSQIDFLIDDNNDVVKEKESLEVVSLFSSLASDQAVALSYDLEGSGTFVPNSDITSTGETLSKLIISNGRYHETQVRMTITSGTTGPTIKGLVFIKDGLESEKQY